MLNDILFVTIFQSLKDVVEIYKCTIHDLECCWIILTLDYLITLL